MKNAIQPMNVAPRSPVAQLGGSTSMLCETRDVTPLDRECSIMTPHANEEPLACNEGRDAKPIGRFRYFGSDLNAGHCGVSIAGITEEDNGVYVCRGKSVSSSVGRQTLDTFASQTVIVLRPPTVLELSVSQSAFIVGDTLHATCVVRDSRPASLITWYLGDDVIRKDAINDELDESWQWSWDMQTTTQHVKEKLGLKHDRQMLRCVAENLASNQSVENSTILLVTVALFKTPATRPTIRAQQEFPLDEESGARVYYMIPGKSFDLICRADYVMDGCQFLLKDVEGDEQEIPIIDFSLGSNSKEVKGKLNNVTSFKASYKGRGLKQATDGNECGLTLQLFSTEPGKFLFGCRAREWGGLWGYYYQVLYLYNDVKVTNVENNQFMLRWNIDEKKPGDDFEAILKYWPIFPNNMTLKLEESFSSVKLPGRLDWVNISIERIKFNGFQSSSTTGYVEQTIILRNITESDKGLVFFRIPWNQKPFLYKSTALQISKSPTSVELILSPSSHFVDGDTLQATCVIRETRPFIRVSRWVLGNRELLFDELNSYVPEESWMWPWDLQTVKQEVFLKLALADDGLELGCIVEHLFLNETLKAFKVIHVCRKSFTLNIKPYGIYFATLVGTALNPATVMCNSAVPLSVCQFRFRDLEVRKCSTTAAQEGTSLPGPDDSGQTVELSKGPHSAVTKVHFCNERVVSVSYYGTGLEHGECGIRIKHITTEHFAVGCRAGAEAGEWAYSEMNIIADKSIGALDPILLELLPVVPRLSVAIPGNETTILFRRRNNKAIAPECKIFLPNVGGTLSFNDRADSQTLGGYKYFGKDLNVGHCGVKILNVSEAHNGPWISVGFSNELGFTCPSTMGTHNVIVAKLPTAVEIQVSSSTFIDGDTLHATCIVRGSRPASLITWYLGDDVIRRDAVNDVRDEVWRWSWDPQTTTQQVAILLNLTHDSLYLRCVAQHLALNQSLENVQLITVDPKVPPGYQQVCGFNTYKFHSDVTTYDDAAAVCKSEGTQMAVINSDLECDVITTLVKRHTSECNVTDDVSVLVEVEKDDTTIKGGVSNETGCHGWSPGNQMCIVYNGNKRLSSSQILPRNLGSVCELKHWEAYSTKMKVNNTVSAAACFLGDLASRPTTDQELSVTVDTLNNLLLLNHTYLLLNLNTTNIVRDVETILANTVLGINSDVIVIEKSQVSLIVSEGKLEDDVRGFSMKYQNDSRFTLSPRRESDTLIEEIRLFTSTNNSLCVRVLKAHFKRRLIFQVYKPNTMFLNQPITNSTIMENTQMFDTMLYFTSNNYAARKVYMDIIFRPVNKEVRRRTTLQTCAYWDKNTEAWDTERCSTLYFRTSLRMCRCYTMSPGDQSIISDHFVIYEYAANISKSQGYVGVTFQRTYHASEIVKLVLWSVSAVGLTIIAITGIAFEKWRKEQSNQIKLHMTASSALYLVLNTCILISKYDPSIDDFQRNDFYAISFMSVLRYSLLSQCTWSLVLSILQLKRLLTVLGSSTTENLLLKVSTFAWGVPAIPLSVLLSWDQYVHICLNSNIIFFSTIVAPQTLVVIINIGILIYVSFHVCACCGCGEKKGLKRHGITDWTLALRRLKQVIFLFFLFGIPNAFELIHVYVYQNEILLWFYYITETLQGFLLFLFFILLDDALREEWKRVIFE